MKRYRNKAFRFNPDIDKAYRGLFGPSDKAGCVICGKDEPELLDIHEADDGNEFRVLYNSCRCNLPEKYNKTEARVNQWHG